MTINTMLDTTIINNALVLTDKRIEDMFEIQACLYDGTPLNGFSIEKFCYYLLSPEFIEKYHTIYIYKHVNAKIIGESIYEYQLGNEVPLTILLLKI